MSKITYLEKLYFTFGRKLNDSQVDFWLEELKNNSEQAVKDAVDYLVRYSETFPSLAKLLEATRSTETQKTYEWQDCQFCRGSGRVTVKKTVIQGDEVKADLDFAHRCICKNGDKYSNFPEVKEGWLQNKVAPGTFETDEPAIDITKEA